MPHATYIAAHGGRLISETNERRYRSDNTMQESKQKEHLQEAVSDLKYLLAPGLLGHYTWFEAVELIAFREVQGTSTKEVHNVFSVYIAEQGDMPPSPCDPFLSKKSKKLSGLKGWQFRVTRRPVAIDAVLECIERYRRDGIWLPPGMPALIIGALHASPALFCPPDAWSSIPLNSVLKNNFWSGSYVLELKDHAKSTLQDLVTRDALVEQLSVWLGTLLPLNLSRVPDRIGDIVLQVPANALMVEFRRRPGAPVDLQVAWNPCIAPRAVAVDYRVEQEGLISLQRAPLPVGHLQWQIPPLAGSLQFSVYDTENGMLLAATAPSQVHTKTRTIESYNSTLVEPRRFSVEEPGRQIVTHKVAVWEPSGGGRAAWTAMLPRETDWRGRRELKEKMKQLIESRRFLQYGQGTAHAQAEQMRALQDLRELIRTVNQGAVYLWDPYLSANDILNTLTFCTDTGTELRALTSTKGASLHETGAQTRQADGVPDMSDDSKRQKWIETQHRTLETAFETPARMRLEYRLSSTEKGSFHDRFLIFPGLGRDRTRAWSLGASINHIGAQHCIVQEVAYPEPVQQAFEDFWQQSQDAEFLVWKYK
ncbi:VPA1262 family N-terminal domain-containing protein [Duganella vulcania]|uniref:Uncharacterized protein n=1 Tax=Duganella vulcania TaxID=2692166 RepID=A0A845GTS3_9BURK|nr:VPA1262 family N-terminal domain-containing protein [Duganella vulcania]MYM96067.1 hypothetical protein [Duganella vulcania]